jgi:hypothetical protein
VATERDRKDKVHKQAGVVDPVPITTARMTRARRTPPSDAAVDAAVDVVTARDSGAEGMAADADAAAAADADVGEVATATSTEALPAAASEAAAFFDFCAGLCLFPPQNAGPSERREAFCGEN